MTAAVAATGLAAGRWSVSPKDTVATFVARDALRRPVEGTVPVTAGSVDVDGQGTPARVAARLDLAAVSTGNAWRDRDLRRAHFFDVATSPVLSFAGGPARPGTSGGWLLPGTLSMKGVACPVELAVDVVRRDGGAAQVRATATIDRRSLGIEVPRLLVGRWVELVVVATLAAPARDAG